MKLSAFFCICLLLVVLLFAGNPVSAEIYQFTDESGETHYTNDATSVPNQYRNDVDIQNETVTYGDYYDDYEDEDEYDDEGDDEGDDEDSGEKSQGNLSETEELKARETAFANQSEDLKAEHAMLLEAREEAGSAQEVEDINTEIAEFNKRYKDWRQERKAFKKEVKAYNEQVRQEMEQELEAYKEKKSPSDEEL